MHLKLKMTQNKRGISAWIWVLIILILIVIGLIIYSLVSGNSVILGIGGNSIPQPPALPD